MTDVEPKEAQDILIRYDSDQSWEDNVAERRPPAKEFLGAKFWICKRLLEAASRQGRATMTDAELKDVCEAFRSCLDGASEKDGTWTVPIQPSAEYPTTRCCVQSVSAQAAAIARKTVLRAGT